MAEVNLTYLRKGEHPPDDETAVIIDCGPPGQDSVASTTNHFVYRVSVEDAPALMEKLGNQGVRTIYVAGLDDGV